MERIAINDLPDGTREKLKQRAIKKKFTKLNGEANFTALVRALIIKETEK